jgi:hypothetical protein
VKTIEVLYRLVMRGRILAIILPGGLVMVEVLVRVMLRVVTVVGLLLVVVHLQLAHVKLVKSGLEMMCWIKSLWQRPQFKFSSMAGASREAGICASTVAAVALAVMTVWWELAVGRLAV